MKGKKLRYWFKYYIHRIFLENEGVVSQGDLSWNCTSENGSYKTQANNIYKLKKRCLQEKYHFKYNNLWKETTVKMSPNTYLKHIWTGHNLLMHLSQI